MRAVVLQSSYLPWKGYFDLIHDADVFVYYDEVKYTKNDWRNRNRLCGANGPFWLTIPVSPRATRQRISEVTLADASWQEKHWRSIVHTYSRSPGFGELETLLAPVYRERRWRTLVEVDRTLIETIARRLGCRTVFLDSRDFELASDRLERLLGLLRQVGATEYLSGPAAKDYLAGAEDRFRDAGIVLRYKDYTGYPTYPQLGATFEHGVSIVDLVARVGWEAAPWYVWGWREGASQPSPRRV